MKRLSLLVFLVIVIITKSTAQGTTFDKQKDFLLLNNDTQSDPDDIQAIAAVGSFLTHPDLCGINYFGVIGTNRGGNSDFLPRSVELAKLIYGTENVDWANANKDFGNRIAARDLVVNLVKPIIDNGGKLWVCEAGQADFTYDVLLKLKELGVTETKFKTQVIIVQHSEGNEKTSDQTKLTYLKANTNYKKIDDGNLGGNSTPAYVSNSKTFLTDAKSTKNLNTITRGYWKLADDIITAWNLINDHKNNVLRNGGVDFSDAVEFWYIFKLGNTANTVQTVWDNYIMKAPTTSPCNTNQSPTGSFILPTFSSLVEGYTELYVEVQASDPESDPVSVTLFIDGKEIRKEASARYEWGKPGTLSASETLGLLVGSHLFEAAITDSKGATFKASKTITVTKKNLSVDEISGIEKVAFVYPNPSENGIFNLSNEVAYEVFDFYGKSLSRGTSKLIDLSNRENGVYLLKINGITSKIVK
jgi:hypothetical protein